MGIDVQTIATAAGTALVTSGLVLFVAKQILERLIDSKFKRADEAYRAVLEERTRREAELYDRQVQELDALATSAYEIRDAARVLSTKVDRESLINAEQQLLRIVRVFEGHLRSARPVLPKLLFESAHEVRPVLSNIMTNVELLKLETSPEQVHRYRRRLEDSILIVDAVFRGIMDLTREFRRVDDHVSLRKNV